MRQVLSAQVKELPLVGEVPQALVFVAVIDLTQNQSKEIQMTAIFIAVFVCTIALIWIIVTLRVRVTPARTLLALASISAAV